MVLGDKLKLRRRGLIESVNDLLTLVFDVAHTRHRSPSSSLVTYGFYDCKLSIAVPIEKRLHP